MFILNCNVVQPALHVRSRAKVYIWEKGAGGKLSPAQKARLAVAIKAMHHDARHGQLHMKLDQPDPYGNGGNSDTAGNARRFLSEKNRPHAVELFRPKDDAEREKIRRILEQLSVILRVVSSKEKV